MRLMDKIRLWNERLKGLKVNFVTPLQIIEVCGSIPKSFKEVK